MVFVGVSEQTELSFHAEVIVQVHTEPNLFNVQKLTRDKADWLRRGLLVMCDPKLKKSGIHAMRMIFYFIVGKNAKW